MKIYHKTETWLSIFSLISIVIIIRNYSLPAKNDLSNLLTQIAIGYIINVIFYLTQIYFPKRKEQKKFQSIKQERINEIGSRILSHFFQAFSETLNSKVSELCSNFIPLEDKDFVTMANYPLMNLIHSKRLNPVPHEISLIQAICDTINETKKGIESLRFYFPSLPTEILEQFMIFDNLVINVKSILNILNCETMKNKERITMEKDFYEKYYMFARYLNDYKSS